MVRGLSLCVVLLLVVSSAAAFDFEEHKYVSNLALRIVLADPRIPDETKAALEQLASTDSAEDGKSFGDLVGLADYISDPNPLFTSTLAQSLDAKEVDWEHLQPLRRDLFRWAHAAHNNENHFQELALVAHLNNHQHAILEAKDNWIRAVLFEAYALHFLEDFLSPGHVATGRSGLPDSVAIGLHDRYSAWGLHFRLNTDANADFDALTANLGRVDFTAHPRSRLKLTAKDFAALAALAKHEKPVLKLHGDSRLWENRTQAALVTAFAVRSIREVLMLPKNNTFDKYCWAFGEEPSCLEPGDVQPHRRSILRAARIAYGAYDDRVPSVAWFVPGEILILGHENAYVPGRKSEAPEGRWGLLAETLVVYRKIGKFTPALLVGGARTFGGQPSTAYYLRAVATIPHTDVQFSAKAGARTYRLRTGRDLTMSTFGVAVEGGFAFIFVRFGGEWERDEGRLQQGARLYLSTGISGVIPGRAVLQKLRRR